MGEYAEMMLDGTCCSSCGEYLGSDAGYPIMCAGCAPKEEPKQEKKPRAVSLAAPAKVACPYCFTRVKKVGFADHLSAKHPKFWSEGCA